MRTLGALVCAVMLAACGESSGVMIIVHTPPKDAAQPTEVRLIIGLGEHVELRLGPEGYAGAAGSADVKTAGWSWLRDPNDLGDTAAITAQQPARFVFTPAAGVVELGAVIAIGYAAGDPSEAPLASGALGHLAIGDGNVTVYDLYLQPTVDPRVAANRTAPTQLELWGTNQTCAYSYNAADDDHPSVFIANADDDRDCDALADGDPLECVPNVFLGSRPPVVHEASCLTTTPVVVNNTPGASCMIGGPMCMDGRAPADAPASECVETRYCVPQTACNVCETATPAATNRYACLTDLMTSNPASTGTYTGVKCTVTGLPSQDGLKIDVCGGTSAALDLGGLMAGRTCTGVAIKTLTTPGFVPELLVGQERIRPELDGECTFQLTASGDLLDATPSPLGALLKIDLASEMTASLGLALPITFELRLVSICSAGGPDVECHLITSDDVENLAACLSKPL